MIRLVVCLGLSLSLLACGGGKSSDGPHLGNPSSSSSSSSNTSSSSSQSSLVSQAKQAELSSSALAPVSTEDLEAWLKNGLRLSASQGFTGNWLGGVDAGLAVPELDFSASPPSSNSFSRTNVQVAGVDEADFVKYDGQHLFYAVPPVYTNNGSQQKIRIVRTDAQLAQLYPQSDISLSTEDWGASPELYLVADPEEQTTALATLRRATSFVEFSQLDLLWHYPIGQAGVEVRVYDVTDPSQPGDAWELTFDGDLLGSRKIGNILYLVTGHYPLLPEVLPFPTNSDVREQNESHIASADISRLLPQYRVGDGDAELLVDPQTCLLPQERDSNEGHQQLVSLVAIDLESRTLMDSLCLSTPVQGIYVSPSAIYLGASGAGQFFDQDVHTSIHKFGLTDEGFEYQATGAVKGNLGWDKPAFRMDEYEGDLRVVTSSQPGPVHRLSVLRPNTATKSMTLVAQIPNNQQPAAIGKPNEDIYAVRFDGARAFVVTFERIDPLYVLDLANPAAPRIAGELEIPGFSTYLHPIDENLLFALGQAGDGWGANVKLSLFDVSDMSQPQELGNITFNSSSSWSDALYDHRALSFLRVSEQTLRITLPVNNYSHFSGSDNNSGLYQFEVRNIGSQQAELLGVGSIPNTSDDYGLGARGVMHQQSVFYVRSDKVSAHLWPN